MDLSAIQADPDVLAELQRISEVQDELLRQTAPGRSNKGTNKEGLIAALNDALETQTKSGKEKVTGRNEAFSRLFHDGFEYDDSTRVESSDLLECFAKMLESNPGVTVNRSELEMHPAFGQWALRVYNRPEVGLLAKTIAEEQP